MKQKQLLAAMGAGLIALGCVTSADATLISRISGQAYYDDVADLTWLADANAAGAMNWVNANNWAANLDIDGVTGWRLPTTMQPDASCSVQSNQGASFPLQGFGTGCTGSEMGNLFYNVLGGVANTSITTTHNANYDLFSNVQFGFYWSGAEFAPNTGLAWGLNFSIGRQDILFKNNNLFAWAVQSGDVSASVPEPSIVWLLGGGLVGLIGAARLKSANI